MLSHGLLCLIIGLSTIPYITLQRLNESKSKIRRYGSFLYTGVHSRTACYSGGVLKCTIEIDMIHLDIISVFRMPCNIRLISSVSGRVG